MLVAAMLGAACSTTVNLTIHNKEAFPQTVRVLSKNKIGLTKEFIELGLVDGNSTKVGISFPAQTGGNIEVQSLIPDSGVIFSETLAVTGSEDPLHLTVNIKAQRGRVLDDSESLRAISQSFKKLGPDSGVYPMRLSDALKARFGALIVIPGESQYGQPLLTITPGQFKVKEVALEEIQYSDNVESDAVYVTGKASSQAKLSLPLYGSFGFHFDSDKAYHIKWLLEGFGAIPKPEGSGRHAVTAFRELPKEVKAQVYVVLAANPGSKLVYVNTIYAVKRAQLSIKEGTKISVDGNVDAAAVLSASGAYTFSHSQELTREYSNFVLNYWGDELILIQPASKGVNPMEKLDEPFLIPTGSRVAINPYRFKDLPYAESKDTGF